MTWCWLWFWSLVFPHEPGHGHSGLEADPGKRQARLQTHSSHVPQMVTEPVSAKKCRICCGYFAEKSQVKNHAIVHNRCRYRTWLSQRYFLKPQGFWTLLRSHGSAGDRDAILEAKLVFYVDVSVTVWCKKKQKTWSTYDYKWNVAYVFCPLTIVVRSLLRWMDGEIDK